MKKERLLAFIEASAQSNQFLDGSISQPQQMDHLIMWFVGGVIILGCCCCMALAIFPCHPIEGSSPLILSSLYSWQRAQGSQNKWVTQSGAGVSTSPYLLRIFVRYVHDIMNGTPMNAPTKPYSNALVPHAAVKQLISEIIQACTN